MNITPIKENTLTFSMKFAPEIEAKYIAYKNNITDEDKKQKFINLKKEADIVLKKLPYNDNIKYGCIVRKDGKDYFRHSLNINQRNLKLSIDDTISIEHFFGFFLWRSMKELFEIFPIYLQNKPNSRNTTTSQQ